MKDNSNYNEALCQQGFVVLEEIYSPDELERIISIIDAADRSAITFRQTEDLFAVRQFLKEVPAVLPLIFKEKLFNIIKQLFGDDYFLSKSIYFDKPQRSNWFVAWHRDLTISVNSRTSLPGFTNWTVKQSQYAVQPPSDILRSNFTIRIHLDDTDRLNGALRVVPGSHVNYGCTVEESYRADEVICDVKAGGIMIMKPLLMHASNRTVNDNRRRVIHIEFSNATLPKEIDWSEKIEINRALLSSL